MNLALITIDSLRADHVGCYGYQRDTTPNIDRQASESHRFTDAVAHACATRPSFPSILTSTHGMLYGGFDHLSDEQIPISVPLSEAGFSTGGFHSNPYLSTQFGYARGFDTYSDLEDNPGPLAQVRRYVSNNLSGPIHDVLSWAHTKAEEYGGVDIGAYYQDATSLTDEALSWVDSVEEPWFLWIHYMDPHHPCVPPEKHQVFGETLPQSRGVKLRQKVLDDPDSLSEAEWEELIQLYDAEIRYVDNEIGRLIDGLENTKWILTADHGEEFHDHGNFGHKNRFYEEHVHVPLLFGGADAGTHEHLVGLNDVPVTLLEEVGVSIPDTYRGENLFTADREQVLGGWGHDRGTDLDKTRFMNRTPDKKYIRYTSNGREELYDLSQDPNEHENLSKQDDTKPHEADIREFEKEIKRSSRQKEKVDVGKELEERLQNLGYK